MATVVAEMMGKVMQSRQGASVQQSLTPVAPLPNLGQAQTGGQQFVNQQIGNEPMVLAGNDVVPMSQALTDSVHYPSVVNGKAVQGVTPAQMFGVTNV